MDAKHFIVLVMMLAVLVVLIVGVVSMMRGGEFDRKNSTKLMTLRVWLQAATIAMLGIMFLMSK
jgi:hypothetical protein